jgi:hypothetical protein
MVKYLVCTKHFVMCIEPGSKADCSKVWGFGDTDWAGDPETRRCTACGLIIWGNALLHAHARTIIPYSLSSPEAEYYGQVGVAAELLYVHSLIVDMGFSPTMHLLCDASSAIAISKRQGVGKVRHIELRFLWLQDKLAAKVFDIGKVPGWYNPADIGTKILSAPALLWCAKQIGLRPLTESASGDVPDLNHLLDSVNTIFKTAMLLPAGRRHAIMKLLLTAVSFTPARAYSFEKPTVVLELHSMSFLLGFLVSAILTLVCVHICRGSYRSANLKIESWEDLEAPLRRKLVNELRLYTTKTGRELHINPSCAYLEKSPYEIKQWDVCQRCQNKPARLTKNLL